jgi:SulP family sulfate permease
VSPILRWLPPWLRSYQRDDLRHDALAGVTTAVLLVPQAMAYATLAGLPPIVGLYASTVALVVYALVGTSRQLAVGPVAMVSLMVSAGVSQLAVPATAEYIGLAVLLALMIGVIQTLMGLLRAGFLTNFLSHPVISGFTSAAAIIIALSQLGPLLGVKLPRSQHIHEVVANTADHLGEVHLPTLAVGLITIALLWVLRRWKRTFPGALTVVVLGIGATAWAALDGLGVKIVGDIPAGLPDIAFPGLDGAAITALLPIAIAISLVSFMESISVAKAFARRNNYAVVPNRELVGLGLANIAGSMVGGYPVTGGFSRTAVNASAGARTGLAALVTALLVTLTLLWLTPIFYHLPRAVLAGIVMVAVLGLVDIPEVKHLWKVNRADFAVLVVTFVATLTLGIEPGIGIGVAASLLWLVVRITRPHTAILGRLPGTTIYRNVANFPEAQTVPGVLALRMDAQFFFGNVTFLKDTLRDLEAAMVEPLQTVIIDASAINQLDSSADTVLHELLADYRRRGVRLTLANVKGPVRRAMQRSGLWSDIGQDAIYLEVHAAVDAATDQKSPLDSTDPPRRGGGGTTP